LRQAIVENCGSQLVDVFKTQYHGLHAKKTRVI